jgi:hypothetical protein
MKPLPPLLAADKAWSRADVLRAAFPEPLRPSLPFPVFGAEGLLWCVWLLPSERDADTGALRLGVPEYVLSLRADFGDLEGLSRVRPETLGVAPTGEGPWIGELTDAPAREALRGQYTALLAETAPSFAAGPRSLTPPIKRAAKALLGLFPEVAETPLLPAYRRVGARFFAWLDFASTA